MGPKAFFRSYIQWSITRSHDRYVSFLQIKVLFHMMHKKSNILFLEHKCLHLCSKLMHIHKCMPLRDKMHEVSNFTKHNQCNRTYTSLAPNTWLLTELMTTLIDKYNYQIRNDR